jgi:excisionase family DNA binding protein
VTKPLRKAGRLLLLYRLQEIGALEGLTLQAVAERLGVNRSTVLRDLRDLDAVQAEYRRLAETLPWQPALTVADAARALGARPETIRAMIRDGLLAAHKRPERGRAGRWYIPAQELQRFERKERHA